MTETAIIYVGSDERQAEAERVLEHSIRKHSSIPVELRFMRDKDPGPWGGWAYSWQYDKPKDRKVDFARQHTKFTRFRYAIPEVHRYEGRAIYMDSDILVLGDIAELWRTPLVAPWKCVDAARTCVSVIETSAFADTAWWPKVAAMRADPQLSGWLLRDIMLRRGFLDQSLTPYWNWTDGYQDGVKALHFTVVETQPWQPWPEFVTYQPHPWPKNVELWRQYQREAVSVSSPSTTSSGS